MLPMLPILPALFDCTFHMCVHVCVQVRTFCFAKKMRAFQFSSLLNISLSLKLKKTQIKCKELNTDYQNEKDIYSLDIVAADDVGWLKNGSNGEE